MSSGLLYSAKGKGLFGFYVLHILLKIAIMKVTEDRGKSNKRKLQNSMEVNNKGNETKESIRR